MGRVNHRTLERSPIEAEYRRQTERRRGMPESPTDNAMLNQAQTRLPLNGLKVLDLTHARAGPTAVRHLADWGADVIKIEPPATDGEEITGNRHGFDFQNLHRN